MVHSQPIFAQINLIVQDMNSTIAFYQRLGLTIDAKADDQHLAIKFPNGMLLEFDTTEFAKQWDASWKGANGRGGIVVGFSLPSREVVDQVYADLVGAGYHGHQSPYDAFWGARYAIIDDPDGNSVGLMSPIEQHRKFWPPDPPPSKS